MGYNHISIKQLFFDISLMFHKITTKKLCISKYSVYEDIYHNINNLIWGNIVNQNNKRGKVKRIVVGMSSDAMQVVSLTSFKDDTCFTTHD